jgi:hypothetical protein
LGDIVEEPIVEEPQKKATHVQVNTTTKAISNTMFQFVTIQCQTNAALMGHATVKGCAGGGDVREHCGDLGHEGVVDWEDLFGADIVTDLVEN